MNNFTGEIINNGVPCYFISPHLDDAVLSAGGLISYLSKKVKVEVVNVFTKATNNPPTLSARHYLKIIGYKKARQLYQARIIEDQIALAKLSIKPINLGFIEALWRKIKSEGIIVKTVGKVIPEIQAVYPTYRWHIISPKIATEDNLLIDQISEKLKQIIPQSSLVFVPMGVGSHIDHIIVRDICSQLFNNIIYWSDYPYNQTCSSDRKFVKSHHLKLLNISLDLEIKKDLIYGYKSQVNAVFPDGITSCPPETYFLT